MHLQGYEPEKIYLAEDSLLEQQIIDVPGLRIIPTDYSAGADAENARKNATAAGVAHLNLIFLFVTLLIRNPAICSRYFFL